MKVDDKNNRPLVIIPRQLQTRAEMTIILVNEDNKWRMTLGKQRRGKCQKGLSPRAW